ncbi:MAG: hypothetical protein A2940_02270 [Candidatus Wildermuthbacteria bacterium RIFCSPLOWO2_01_FULL_48_29]|uniref:Uncharacterized protein n=1 Tax=Candidatus Wildermuthbacteria bacterium RIFCSPLOWO2_01_FULL_48_29 TaxID=1802462 RepID=A0A1G2RLZ1_9BACT|nr:MAG: hypothetical protein A2940_02270 [Candidatus Wildermuthbacteria bacterium RIFCSPLOWO2_01_FULL_48_29]
MGIGLAFVAGTHMIAMGLGVVPIPGIEGSLEPTAKFLFFIAVGVRLHLLVREIEIVELCKNCRVELTLDA